MPTADEFDRAAARFDRAASTAGTLLRGSRDMFGPDTMRGGLLPLLVDATLDAAARNASAVAAELHDQANTCRQRAAACRSYAEKLAAYHVESERWIRELQNASDGAATGRRPRSPSKLAFIDIST